MNPNLNIAKKELFLFFTSQSRFLFNSKLKNRVFPKAGKAGKVEK